MKRYLLLALLVGLCGCGGSKVVPVKIVRIYGAEDQDKAGFWNRRSSHTTVERLDNHQRCIIMGCTWGNTGDVFSIDSRRMN